MTDLPATNGNGGISYSIKELLARLDVKFDSLALNLSAHVAQPHAYAEKHEERLAALERDFAIREAKTKKTPTKWLALGALGGWAAFLTELALRATGVTS